MKKHKPIRHMRLSRREFMEAAASVTAFAIATRHALGGLGHTAPSDKLNIACVGVGGRGHTLLKEFGVGAENLVALCDVDDTYAAPAFARFPSARRYRDFRRMLDQEAKLIDAVVVATTSVASNKRSRKGEDRKSGDAEAS